MTHYKQVAAAALTALAVMSTPVNPAVSTAAVPPGQLGVGLSVDSRWIAVEGYFSVRDRGAGAREQAWAGETPPRGAAGAPGRAEAEAGRRVRVVRLAAVPNMVGRTHQNFVVVRALSQAAFALARHVIGGVAGRTDASTLEPQPAPGAHDADRR